MKDKNKKYDVFISYRRDGGEVMARLLYIMLSDRGYSVFYDRVSIKTGRFDETIADAIKDCTDFILVLSENMFKDRDPSKDEVIKELILAKNQKKNILPLQMEGFSFSDNKCYKSMEELKDFNLLNAPFVKIEHFTYEFLSKYMMSKKSNLDGVLSDILAEANEDSTLFRSLDAKTKRDSLLNIIMTSVPKENAEMLLNMIYPYLDKNFNEKKDYRYHIDIRDSLSQLKRLPFKDIESKYYRLEERIGFTKRYVKSEGTNEIWVVFSFNSSELDAHLRADTVFFSEYLNLHDEDLSAIKLMSQDELNTLFYDILQVQVSLNKQKIAASELELRESGIYAKYVLPETLKEVQFKLSFDIPFDIKNELLYLAIGEPTYSPEILIRYDDLFKAELVPFFGEEVTLRDSSSFDGEFEIVAKDSWVMPMSGAIVSVKVKED